MPYNISKTHTLDGHKVAPGLRVWDYDMRVRVVGEVQHTEANGDPWYVMIDPETGRQGSSMNPSRMWVRHPGTNKKA